MIPNINSKIGNNDKFLSRVFNSFINNKYSLYSIISIESLEIYETLLILLKENNLQVIINEIKYRVTDGEDLNDVFINIIESNNNLPLVISMYLTNLYEIENRNWINKFS